MELVSFITTNTQHIYDRINKLYQLEKDINDDDDLVITELKVEPCPSIDPQHKGVYIYNRDCYQWAIRVTIELLRVLNELIGFYNDSGFVDDENEYQETARVVEWWIPRSISLHPADYFDKLQKNYNLANKMLDSLEGYAEINR